MIFSGMIHLNEYFEIVKIIFHNFDVFALLGGLEGKKMAQKPCFFWPNIQFPGVPMWEHKCSKNKKTGISDDIDRQEYYRGILSDTKNYTF